MKRPTERRAAPGGDGWRRCVLAVTLAFALASGAAVTAAPELSVEESRLEICALLQQTPATLTGQLRLLSDVDAEVELLASDLELEQGSSSDPACRIGRDKISLAQPVKLEAGKPHDVTVSVRDVSQPGTWIGTLQLRATATEPSTDGGEGDDGSKTPVTSTVEIPIRLELSVPPNVEPVYEQRVFRLVRCQNQLSCFFARLLLRESMLREHWRLVLDNQGPQAVTVEQAKALLLGEKTGHRPAAGVVELQAPATLEADRLSEIDLKIQRSELDPDQYSGEFRFELGQAREPVKIKADVFVRQGPMPALLVLLFGIMVGRMARVMQGETAKRQVKRLPGLEGLKAEGRKLENAESRRFVERQLGELDRALERGRLEDEVWEAQTAALEAKITLLAEIEALEREVAGQGRDQLERKLAESFEKVRGFVFADQLEEAEKAFEQARQQELGQALRDKTLGSEAAQLGEKIGEDLAQVRATQRRVPRAGGGPLGAALAWLSGLENYQPEIRYWLVRPLLWLTLLAALALLGLEALYVDEATFGAGGVFDFLGLFIWGLTSDIARQGLLSLQRAGQQGS